MADFFDFAVEVMEIEVMVTLHCRSTGRFTSTDTKKNYMVLFLDMTDIAAYH